MYFQAMIPEIAYPSCIFNSCTYVKHYLTCDFPSIEAKKTIVIVIKNRLHFTNYNALLKTPALCYKEVNKTKLGLFNYGSFNATVILPKNFYSYEDDIPIVLDINCPKLQMGIKSLKISICKTIKKNFYFRGNTRSKENVEIYTKKIPLDVGKPLYHIEEFIKLPAEPDVNPKEMYKKLDKDKRGYNDKYKGVVLFPSCYDGLICCEYYVKIVLEMDSWFSSNEEFKIPVDLYEDLLPSFDMKGTPNTAQGFSTNVNNTTIGEYKNEFSNIPYNQAPNTSHTVIIQNNMVGDLDEDELPSQEEIVNQSQNNKKNEKEKETTDGIEDSCAPPPSFITLDNNSKK
jgi:hypothetical protein